MEATEKALWDTLELPDPSQGAEGESQGVNGIPGALPD